MPESSIIRGRCRVTRRPTPATSWWDRPWVAPPFGWLVTHGLFAATAAGAIAGTLTTIAIMELSSGGTAVAFVVFPFYGAAVGVGLGGLGGCIVAPLLAAGLIATSGTRRHALAVGICISVVATTTVAMSGILLATGGLAFNASASWFIAIVDIAAYLATQAVVIRAATSPMSS